MANTNTRLYIANLGKYNEGELIGEWIDLPFDEEEFQEFLKEEVGINEQYEEYAIHDYETDTGINIGEYTNIITLNALIEEIEFLDEYDYIKLKAIIEAENGDIENIQDYINNLDNYHLIEDVKNDYNLGYYYIHDAGIYNLNEMGSLANYIDYERFGSDCSYNGMFTKYGFLEIH